MSLTQSTNQLTNIGSNFISNNNRLKTPNTSKLNNCHDEWMYDIKCKENTKKQKGKSAQREYLKKKLFKLKTEWKNENIIDGIKISSRKHKSNWLPEYKQDNVKNYRKSSFQKLKQFISKK